MEAADDVVLRPFGLHQEPTMLVDVGGWEVFLGAGSINSRK